VSGDPRVFSAYADEAKLEQVRGPFAQDVDRLLRELPPELRPGRADLEHALASLPVYRTYVDPVRGNVDPEDRRWITASGMGPEIAAMLLLEREAPAGFVTRFQQTTPAIMAKGVEDTAFYRYCRLISLNDVGGAPSRFGIAVERFHARCLERANRFPFNLLTTQTHDAKRSADVRARIDALSSMPHEWSEHVERWFEITERRRDLGAPDDVERYFLFQTLVGAWPIAENRIEAYMEKALREAKRNTNWTTPNADWEAAVKRFCRSLYADRAFLADFEPFAAQVAAVGERAALGQAVLKLTAPGIPDMYEGDELAFRALVDPDNRRPVDFDWRQAMLRRLMGGSPPVPETRKLFVTLRLLGLRARRPEPFAAAYEPLDAGPSACAFVRGGEVLVVVAVRSGAVEGTLAGPGGHWRDVLRGEERSFDSRTQLRHVAGELGIAVFERL
jgi:(1->4)-alpha-D-glucan 1-alpha-D-glucosylmutase